MTPVRDDSGAIVGMLLVFSDVTEARELVQARQDLSSMIVHDLRGPLTAISTSLKLLHEIAPLDDPLGRAVRQTTETSARAMRKLLNLVDSLLDVSKLESGTMTLDLTMLRSMCVSVVDELRRWRGTEIGLRLDVGDLPDRRRRRKTSGCSSTGG
jgi:signal transduction histidine kinase